jgi:hypothetical protein
MTITISTDQNADTIIAAFDLLARTEPELRRLSNGVTPARLSKPPGTSERSFTETLARIVNCESRTSEAIPRALPAKEPSFTPIHPGRPRRGTLGRNLGKVTSPLPSTTALAGSQISDRDWALVVMWFVALNVLDLGLTLHLVGRGAVEMNPVMAALLDGGWGWAAAFKLATSAGVAAGLWVGRRHLLIRRTGIAFLVLLAAITVYQVVDVWAAS